MGIAFFILTQGLLQYSKLMPSALRFDKYNLTGEVGLVSAWNPGMVTRSLGGG